MHAVSKHSEAAPDVVKPRTHLLLLALGPRDDKQQRHENGPEDVQALCEFGLVERRVRRTELRGRYGLDRLDGDGEDAARVRLCRLAAKVHGERGQRRIGGDVQPARAVDLQEDGLERRKLHRADLAVQQRHGALERARCHVVGRQRRVARPQRRLADTRLHVAALCSELRGALTVGSLCPFGTPSGRWAVRLDVFGGNVPRVLDLFSSHSRGIVHDAAIAGSCPFVQPSRASIAAVGVGLGRCGLAVRSSRERLVEEALDNPDGGPVGVRCGRQGGGRPKSGCLGRDGDVGGLLFRNARLFENLLRKLVEAIALGRGVCERVCVRERERRSAPSLGGAYRET